MLAQANPEVFEAFDVDYAEEAAWRAELAAEAAAEEDADDLSPAAREWQANAEDLLARLATAFEPARRLYAVCGFSYCEPFGDYVNDPNSVFMTLEL